MTVKTGISSSTPDRIVIDAGAVYLNYGLANQRLLGATRGGNEFNLNRVTKNIEADGLKGAVKGMKRVTEVNPQITANLLELSVDNLIAAIAGASQEDLGYITSEWVAKGDGAKVEFPLNQNDVVPNSERVYLSDADGKLTLKTRSKKYASRFVGVKAADNKEFEASVGDWTENGAEELVHAAGGFKGNCMKYLAGTEGDKVTFTLAGGNGAVLTNLVIGQHYRFQLAVKVGTWASGGDITPVIAGVGTPVLSDITPTTDWTVYVFEFIADTADATITLTTGGTPGSGDVIYFDFFELERVDNDYVMKWDGGDKVTDGAKASVIFSEGSAPTTDNQIIISYTYAKSSPDHTTITGGEIGDTDYIDNVAIVGNVSGKNKPVICMVKNALADTGFSLATAPRDEAVPAIVFTGHYDPDDLDTEPWEMRWPNA